MTTDKTPATLATVKHGGCVQLASSERERFEAWARTHHRLGESGYLEREQLSGDYRLQPTDYAWTAWQAALSAQPSPGGQDAPRCAEHCQNGFADICLASQRDGVICPEDSCDIDDGVRRNHLAASQSAASVPQGCDACHRTGIRRNDEGRNVFCPDCDLGATYAGNPPQPSPGGQGDALLDHARKLFDEMGMIADDDKCVAILADALAARQPVRKAVAWIAEGDAERWAVDPRSLHISGLTKRSDSAGCTVPLYAAPPAQAVDLGELREMLVGWKNSDYPFSYEGQCAQRALDACVADLQGWLDSQAVAK